MTRRISGLIALAPVVLAAMGANGCTRPAPKPRTHAVTMAEMRFEPATLEVAAGDTIVWTNKDLVPHTATSSAGGFDSDMIQPDQSWTTIVRSRGAFPYVCRYHPTMTGTVKVE